ncbi:MAG: ribonuclease III [Desulfonauticus sp.]|nr:ribonuclease III [Desulfonauticus sp.]
MEKYKFIFKALSYNFKKLELFKQAITHTSYANERGTYHNERLEFLGDAVLELAISEILYFKFPQAEEGKLTKARAFLVNETSLAQIARRLKLGEVILLGKGEESQGGRTKNSILADTLEAILGAIYLDSQSFKEVKRVINCLFGPLIPSNLNKLKEKKDYKTLLQEYTQEHFGDRPVYTLIKSTGPDHAKIFHVKVTIPRVPPLEITTQGYSIKGAEQKAAQKALSILHQTEPTY